MNNKFLICDDWELAVNAYHINSQTKFISVSDKSVLLLLIFHCQASVRFLYLHITLYVLFSHAESTVADLFDLSVPEDKKTYKKLSCKKFSELTSELDMLVIPEAPDNLEF